jgi:hypothetical protein
MANALRPGVVQHHFEPVVTRQSRESQLQHGFSCTPWQIELQFRLLQP